MSCYRYLLRVDAALQETDEAWMKSLREFSAECLEVARPTEASTAAEVRRAFDAYNHGGVPKKESGLPMARKGYKEERVNYWGGVKRCQKRCYKVQLESGAPVVAVKAQWRCNE